MSSIIKEEASRKLGKFIFLPLIKINPKLDCPGYIDSFLTKENNIILITSNEGLPKLLKSEYYLSDYSLDDDTTLIVYKPSLDIKKELEKFRYGLWSKFTSGSFDKLKKYSNLPYKRSNSKTQVIDTHTIFLAIEKSDILKDALERELRCSINSSNEYLQKPADINFAEFEDFFKEELEQQ